MTKKSGLLAIAISVVVATVPLLGGTFAWLAAGLAVFLVWLLRKVLVDELKSNTSAVVEAVNQVARSQIPAVGSLTGEFQPVGERLQALAGVLSEQVKKQKAVIDYSADVICIIDMSLNFVSINPAVKVSWGYEPSELTGKYMGDFLAPEVREQSLKAMVGSEHSIDRITFETRFRKKDESYIHVLWSAHWSATEKGLFCVAHDITARVEMEQLKREYAALIGHELRTPLTSIQATLAMMEDGVLGELPPDTVPFVGQANKEAERLIELVNELLDLEKIEAGKFSLNLQPVDLSKSINESIEIVRHLARKKDIAIETSLVAVNVLADQARLLQVLLNLLSNAVKFSSPNSELAVSLEEESDCVKIKVRDSGPGIPAEKQDLLFKRFVRLPGADGSGTGLGLAICKAIVEDHGGRIGVVSCEGNGSEFWFSLPKVL